MPDSEVLESLKDDYYSVLVPKRVVAGLCDFDSATRCAVLELEFKRPCAMPKELDRRTAALVAYPQSIRVLVDIVLTKRHDGEDGERNVEILLRKRALEPSTDFIGSPAPCRLDIDVGAASSDTVLRYLDDSLRLAISQTEDPEDPVVHQLAEALRLRVAHQLGHLRTSGVQSPGGLASWQLRLAKQFLAQHGLCTLSLVDLAHRCGLSLGHFSRAFARSTGTTPHRWMMERRIERAKRMMRQGSTPLAQISSSCGFSDQSHFTKAFAEHTGTTPGRWRNGSRHSKSTAAKDTFLIA